MTFELFFNNGNSRLFRVSLHYCALPNKTGTVACFAEKLKTTLNQCKISRVSCDSTSDYMLVNARLAGPESIENVSSLALRYAFRRYCVVVKKYCNLCRLNSNLDL